MSQNPNIKPARTELTNGQLGWEAVNLSKMSTLIGVTILKRSGCSAMVQSADRFSNSVIGGCGSGLAVNVHSATVNFRYESGFHRLCHRYLGFDLKTSPQLSLVHDALP